MGDKLIHRHELTTKHTNETIEKKTLHCEYLLKNGITSWNWLNGSFHFFFSSSPTHIGCLCRVAIGRRKNKRAQRWFNGIKTFFCRNLIANFRRFKCIRSPCSNIGPDKLVGSWFSITSSSFEVRVWSNNAVAKSWHCRLNSWYSLWNLHKQSICYSALVKISLSIRNFFSESIWLWLFWIRRSGHITLNSCSKKLKRRSSHESSKAVNIGSFDDNDIKLGLAKARYAFIRERECRSESSSREITQSSQPHL